MKKIMVSELKKIVTTYFKYSQNNFRGDGTPFPMPPSGDSDDLLGSRRKSGCPPSPIKDCLSFPRTPSPELFEGEGKTPTPKISALLRKRPVLLKTIFILTKDPRTALLQTFCGKIQREGSCSKAAGGP